MDSLRFTATDFLTGRALPGARVAVYLAGTQTPAALFTDRSGTTAQSNPFNADPFGLVYFAAADGLYDVLLASGANVQPLLSGIQLLDLAPVTTMAQAAALYANGQPVRLGPYSYPVTTQILNSNVPLTFQGVSGYQTTIQGTQAGTAANPLVVLNWYGATDNTAGYSVHQRTRFGDFAVNGLGMNSYQTGLQLNNFALGYAGRLTFKNLAIGMTLRGVLSSTITADFEACGIGITSVRTQEYTDNALLFLDCHLRGLGQASYFQDGGSGNNFVGGTTENCGTGHRITLTPNNGLCGPTFNGHYWEANQGTELELDLNDQDTYVSRMIGCQVKRAVETIGSASAVLLTCSNANGFNDLVLIGNSFEPNGQGNIPWATVIKTGGAYPDQCRVFDLGGNTGIVPGSIPLYKGSSMGGPIGYNGQRRTVSASGVNEILGFSIRRKVVNAASNRQTRRGKYRITLSNTDVMASRSTVSYEWDIVIGGFVGGAIGIAFGTPRILTPDGNGAGLAVTLGYSNGADPSILRTVSARVTLGTTAGADFMDSLDLDGMDVDVPAYDPARTPPLTIVASSAAPTAPTTGYNALAPVDDHTQAIGTITGIVQAGRDLLSGAATALLTGSAGTQSVAGPVSFAQPCTYSTTSATPIVIGEASFNPIAIQLQNYAGTFTRGMGMTSMSAPTTLQAGLSYNFTFSGSSTVASTINSLTFGLYGGATPASITAYRAGNIDLTVAAGVAFRVLVGTVPVITTGPAGTGFLDVNGNQVAGVDRSGNLTATSLKLTGISSDTLLGLTVKGTWTPTLSGATTAGTPTATVSTNVFTAVTGSSGTLVDGATTLAMTALGGAGGTLQMALPRVAGAQGGTASVNTSSGFTLPANVVGLYGVIAPNGSVMTFFKQYSNGTANAPLTTTDLGSQLPTFIIAITYWN